MLFRSRAFEIWYKSGRNFEFLCSELDITFEEANKIYLQNKWTTRANRCDEAARRKLETACVEKQAEFLLEQEKAANVLRQQGLKFFQDQEITNARDAIAAVKVGIELGRSAIQLPEEYKQVEEIRNASSEELIEFVRRLQSRLASTGDTSAIELECSGGTWSVPGEPDREEDE